MPLFDMSINTQDVESSARKRAHSEFENDENVKPQDSRDLLQVGNGGGGENSRNFPFREAGAGSETTDNVTGLTADTQTEENAGSSTPLDLTIDSPTVKGSPGLTESGSSPPEENSPSPTKTPTRAPLVQSTLARFTTNLPPPMPKPAASSSKAPTQQSKTASSTSTSTSEPAAKRKKVSPEEKAAKEAAEEAKKKEKEAAAKAAEEAKKEKEAAKAAKAAELAKLEAEKKRKAEEKKKEKEEADKLKAEQKAAREAEKAAKEAEKQRRLEEREAKRREKEEEEAKKARSQKKLTAMFKMTGSATLKKDKPVIKSEKDQEDRPADAAVGSAEEKPYYKEKFQSFYVKGNVKMADTLFIDTDTCNAKTKILEEWIEGKRGELALGPFNPLEACQLIRAPIHRGRVYPKVSKIMAEYHGDSNSTVPVTESQIRHTREALKSVPVKTLKFREDVRPPYIGTLSGLPTGVKSLVKLAKNPTRKDILPLNYDYDSEAEWQEDDGEDVDDLDDEEEDLENDDDMDDFLDDSEDAGPARLLFSGGMEPESTGLCWESNTFVNNTDKMEQYRLELMPEHLENHASIDPWATEGYWPEKDEKKRTRGKDENGATAPCAQSQGSSPVQNSSEIKTGTNDPCIRTSIMAPPPVPTDAFHALTAKSTEKKPAQKLPADAQEELKALLRSKPDLSKVGIIEVFFANYKKKYPKTQIKATVDDLTEKAGKGWKLKDT